MLNSSRKTFSSLTLIFICAWLLFMAKGIFYSMATPLWEGIDEPFHFAYIHSVAATHSLPVWDKTFVGQDIAESTALVPLPPLMPQLTKDGRRMSYSDYWRLQPQEREALSKRLHALRAGVETAQPSSARLYQAQHPPLYYLLCLPLYEHLDSADLVDKVYALRIFSVFLVSLSLIPAAFIGKRRGLSGATCIALIPLWPGLYPDIARVGNDSLGATIFSALLLTMIFYTQRRAALWAACIGITLGLGLLTKAYFLTAIPAVVFFMMILAVWKKELKHAFLTVSLALVCAVTIAGWWYLRNFMLYGTFSGLQESIYFPSVGLLEKLRVIPSMPWSPFLKHLFVTFSWVSGWSFLHLPKGAYVIFAAPLAVAVVGIPIGLIFRSSLSPTSPGNGFILIGCVALSSFFALGVVYHEINVRATVKVMGGPGGWYLYAPVLPLGFLVSSGITAFGRKAGKFIFAVFSAALFVTEIYGLVKILFPYYEGLVLPSSNGWGVERTEGIAIPVGEAMGRLLANKPALLSPTLAIIAAVACVLLYLATMAAWFFLNGKTNSAYEAAPGDVPASRLTAGKI